MSSTPPPASKRRRTTIKVETVVDDTKSEKTTADDEMNEDEDLLKLLNDDEDFVSVEQRQEEAAAQRRALRRKRLQQVVAANNSMVGDDTDIHTHSSSNGTNSSSSSSRNKTDVVDHSTLQHKKAATVLSALAAADFILKEAAAAAGPGGDSTVNESEVGQQQQQPEKKDSEDDDEFDMFSSSVSPPSAASAGAARTMTVDETTSSNNMKQQQQQKRGGRHEQHQQQDWDDVEGYYKAVIGETISLQIQTTSSTISSAAASTADNHASAAAAASSTTIAFRVLGVVGKGVFSTVLKCTTISNSSSCVLPPTVALKCIRHNDSMTKAAQTEIRCLQQLNANANAGAGAAAAGASTTGIVPLLLPHNNNNNNNNSTAGSANNSNHHGAIQYLEHCGHLILVFPFMEYNLRDVLQKFGKNVGLSLQAVRSYAGQLLAAATHLKRHSILHLDLKPDNILVSADFSTVQLADFGSVQVIAADQSQNNNNNNNSTTTTPYLVSRFYRAPEIILGLAPLTFAVDLWSLAVTVAEVFLGRVLFHGHSNNDMLYVFMQHLGPFSNRVIRQHLVSCQKHGPRVVARHFQQEATTYVFLQQTVDAVTGEAVHKVLSLQQQQQSSQKNGGNSKNKFPLATPLRQKLLQAKSAKDSRALVLQFADLLQKALALDPTRRISLKEALQHDFFQDEKT